MTAAEYTRPSVLAHGAAEGWAEAETDPARINWPARQARAAIPFEVVNGRPVNPREKTAVTRGRNEMGSWGENLMADALVTCTVGGARNLLMVDRGDGYGWAVPGGHVEPGETPLQAALRELAEETGLDAMSLTHVYMVVRPARYVPDPRASDEAWAVTWPAHVHLAVDHGSRSALPAVSGGDDARRAEWIPAGGYAYLTAAAGMLGGRVFAAHVPMLREFLGGDRGASAG
jgi:ADP-ribose pyrophosphatase YjhB (NUDIX family)